MKNDESNVEEKLERLDQNTFLNYNALVVDDDQDMINLVENYFKNPRFHGHLFEAHDPAEAIEFLKENSLDFCVMDIGLGRHNGLHLAKTLRLLSHYEIPILFITKTKEMIQDYYRQDIRNSYFLPKPFTKNDLLKVTEMMVPEMFTTK
jgi:DNA-binding response OmpR family regulator